MTLEITPAAKDESRPDIHVWMTPQEAAAALDTSVTSLDLQVGRGELESRLTGDGLLQVLVRLPERRAAARVTSAVPLATATVRAPSIAPLARAMTATYTDQVRRARQSARIAWAAAAALAVAAGGAVLLGAARFGERGAVPQSALQVAQASANVENLSSERDALRTELAEARQKLQKVQAELVVDRNVEDTLIKAVLAAKQARAAQSKSPLYADSSN